MTTDRSMAPPINPVPRVKLSVPEPLFLSNGIPVYIVEAGALDLCRIELLFKAGNTAQEKKLTASFASSLSDSGTPRLNAEQIAESIDAYGAFLENEFFFDYASVNLYSLTRHVENASRILGEVIRDASFPENEFEVHSAFSRQRFLVAMKKVQHICSRKFSDLLFGNNHPYSTALEESDFDAITSHDVRRFYHRFYRPDNLMIFVSGQPGSNILSILEKEFGKIAWPSNDEKPVFPKTLIPVSESGKFHIKVDDALQSAIKIGKRCYGRKDPRFPLLALANTALGGYFGSRLMANIREDKGYTYGIGSGIMSLEYDAFWSISTEVGADVTADALKEIYFEIRKMNESGLSQDELATVKNYMLGSFLGSLDSPFQIGDKVRTIAFYGLDKNYYEYFTDKVSSADALEVGRVFNDVFSEENLVELVVGLR